MNSKPVCKHWFATKKISDDLYLISEPHYYWWNRANLWFIKGHTQDLLIDTGLGVSSLTKHLGPIIDKPMLVIASHIHFDHAGGMQEFDQVAIHAAEAQALRTGDEHAAICARELGWVLDDHFQRLPYPGFTAEQYSFNAVEPTRILHGGDILDLGNRAFEVLHLPGHSPGSIALYDSRSRELFSGDVVYDGELLDELPGSDIPAYIGTYERLQKLPVHTVYPGHYGIFGKQRLHQLLAEYLKKRREPGVPSSINPGTKTQGPAVFESKIKGTPGTQC